MDNALIHLYFFTLIYAPLHQLLLAQGCPWRVLQNYTGETFIVCPSRTSKRKSKHDISKKIGQHIVKFVNSGDWGDPFPNLGPTPCLRWDSRLWPQVSTTCTIHTKENLPQNLSCLIKYEPSLNRAKPQGRYQGKSTVDHNRDLRPRQGM